MRKHFLILMLFTLLPLVGWAYDNVTFTVHIGDNDVELSGQGEAVTAYLTYDATDKALPFPTKIGEEEIHQGQGQGKTCEVTQGRRAQR